MIFAIFLSIILLINQSNQLITSSNSLKKLLAREEDLIQKLDENIVKIERIKNVLLSTVPSFDHQNQFDAIQQSIALIEMIDTWNGINQMIISYQEQKSFPNILDGISDEDLDDYESLSVLMSTIFQSILRIQKARNLSVDSLVNNQAFEKKDSISNHFVNKNLISDKVINKQLTMKSFQAYSIGLECMNENDYGRAIEWLEASLRMTEKDGEKNSDDGNEESIPPLLILRNIEYSHSALGNIEQALDTHMKIRSLLDPNGIAESMDSTMFGYQAMIRFGKKNEQDLFYYLCSNISETKSNEMKIQSNMKCYHLNRYENLPTRYSPRIQPRSYAFLMRIKMEDISIDPHIFILHDFISKNESKFIMKQSEDRMGSFIQDFLTGDEGTTPSSLQTVVRDRALWYKSDQNELADSITMRVYDFLGFQTKSMADPRMSLFTVRNYGLGGHQDTHYDSHVSKRSDMSDIFDVESRIHATVNTFLSEIIDGGETVFPILGLVVKPPKNSALVWFNHHGNNGSVDMRLRHGSCPVIQGSKWNMVHAIRTLCTNQ